MAPSKVFIVTGASKGIGAAIANHLLSQSHKVVLAARSGNLLAAVKEKHPGHVEYVAGDMTNEDIPKQVVDLAVKSFGKLDGIVINHGVLNPQKLSDSSVADFKLVYDVNVFSCLAMAQAGLQELRKTKGSIVWVGSGAARGAYMGWSAYGSSKAAINSISAHLAFEERDIISVTLAPGRVDTEMQGVIRSDGKDAMDMEQYQDFVDVFERGGLLKPEQPGTVIAKFVANPSKELSGKALNWDSPEMAAFQA